MHLRLRVLTALLKDTWPQRDLKRAGSYQPAQIQTDVPTAGATGRPHSRGGRPRSRLRLPGRNASGVMVSGGTRCRSPATTSASATIGAATDPDLVFFLPKRPPQFVEAVDHVLVDVTPGGDLLAVWTYGAKADASDQTVLYRAQRVRRAYLVRARRVRSAGSKLRSGGVLRVSGDQPYGPHLCLLQQGDGRRFRLYDKLPALQLLR